MKESIFRLVNRLPYIRTLRKLVEAQGRYPAGHYYSPIPKKEEVEVLLQQNTGNVLIEEVDLQEDEQKLVLKRYSQFYTELPFTEQKELLRYYYNQSWFCYFDAISLYCFLRDKQPKRIIEIGSGFSSAVMLDTIELFFENKPKVTFIEPYPERLYSLLRENDKENVTILETPVQKVETNLFSQLEENDLLFIDSSHVLKYGSDLHFLFFQIIPRLKKGVFIHFHDIIYPFEYFSEWLEQGRYWNEAYFLRSFLAYNDSWKIHFFNSYAAITFKDELSKKMPLCLKNTGGSLYIQRFK
jgi:hypothetical protein